MSWLNADAKSRITEILDSTSFTQKGFTVKFDDEDDPRVTITFSDTPEYRFIMNSTQNDEFITSESPGIHSDASETFQRSHFELCMNAIKAWVGRIIDRRGDWILDEFGGVGDINPGY
jgi:hypothetical protein